ncbi:MAG TPA: zf-HC2 domain-containing protein [Thermoanaerobaculia bacterium]|nr:zf-HC2 domain-containing protein [Thermoanaerobaculia bacterium]
MRRSDQPIHAAMVALTREELGNVEHPSASRLIAYHRGEIPPAEVAAIREHLSLCKECTALVLDAVEFFADDEEAAPADLEASWQEFRAATRAEERPPSPVLYPPTSIPHRSFVRSRAFAYGAVAIFAAISVGLFLFKETSPPPRPQVNVGLYDLTSSGPERGVGAQATPIRFQTPGGSALLILNPAVVVNSARYGVRIHRADGAVVWRSEDLLLQAPGGFHLSLPAGALPLGSYSLELYGITGGREKLLGTYRIVIEK